MCGIVGYTGVQGASPILLEGLKKLEYRGYDSAGIALLNEGKISIAKSPDVSQIFAKKPTTEKIIPVQRESVTHAGPHTVRRAIQMHILM